MTDDSLAWRLPRWARAGRAVLLLALGTYAATFVPGVRGSGPPFRPLLDIGMGDGIIVLAALLCLARAWWWPGGRAAWVLLGAGALSTVLGDVHYYVALQDLDHVPYPSWADAAWLAMYPLVNIALVLLVRRQMSSVRTSLWLDGLTGGVGAAALVGAVVLRPVLDLTGGSLPVVLTNLAYPVGDLALLVVLTVVFNLNGWRPERAWWLIAAAPAVLLVVDTVYLLQVSADTYVDGGLLDLGWPVAYCALGLAACARPPERRDVHDGAAAVAVPATLSVLSTGVLFWGALHTLPLVVCILGLAAVLLASSRLLVALVETRRLVEARLQARTDELTALPNRRMFLEQVHARLADETPRAVMIVDLDRFKQVNDSLGHRVGDSLLQIIGGRLLEDVTSPGTLVARLGGDEFAVLADGADGDAARRIGDRVREVIAEPITLSGLTLGIDASIGIALSPAHGTTWEALMSRADAAMYVAKANRSGVEVFVESRDAGGIGQLALLAELREALATQTLDLHYQLVHTIATGSVSSAEALVRWDHPTRGRLSPADFLPLTVEAGLSRALTDEVLRMATGQAARWVAEGRPLQVAVNLSEADLLDAELPNRVAAACEAAALPAHYLRLEVTESITAVVAEAAVGTLTSMRDAGHDLLLDDFGTGYSSLSLLRNLPLDELKLDRSFLADIVEPSAVAMVRATIDLAHDLGLRIVAEGVESDDVLELLRELGCDSVQGFLLHRPAPAGDVTEVLRASRRAALAT